MGLAPAREYRDEADLGAELPGTGGDRAQCLGGCPEQNGVDGHLVLEGNRRDLGGQREHHLEIGHRYEFARTRG